MMRRLYRNVRLAIPFVDIHNLTYLVDFAQHFKEISKTYSPEPRPFRVHLTSVIVRRVNFSLQNQILIWNVLQDTKATAVTLHAGEKR